MNSPRDERKNTTELVRLDRVENSEPDDCANESLKTAADAGEENIPHHHNATASTGINDAHSAKNQHLSAPANPAPGVQATQGSSISAWMKVLGSSLIMVNIMGFQVCFGVLEAYYKTTLLTDYSLGQISLIGSVQGFLLSVVGALSGPLYDRGYHDILVYSSGGILVLGIMLLSLATQYYQIFLTTLLFGIGSGLIYGPSLALVAAAFPPNKRPLALSITSTGSSIGGIIYSVIFYRLVNRAGYAWTIRVLGFAVLATTAFAVACLRPRRSSPQPPRSVFELHAFTELPYVILCIGGFLRYLGLLIPYTYAPIYGVVVLKLTPDDAFKSLIYVNAASLCGRLVAGKVASRPGGLMPVWTACAFASGITGFCWIAVHDHATFIVWLVFMGFFIGPLFSLPSAVIPYISPLSVLGTRMGMVGAIGGAGQLVGSPVAGAISDIGTANFLPMQIFCGVCMLGGAICQLPLWWLIRKGLAMSSGGRKTMALPASRIQSVIPGVAGHSATARGNPNTSGGSTAVDDGKLSFMDDIEQYLDYDTATGKWRVKSRS